MAGPNLVVIGDVMLDVMVSSGGLVRGAVDAGSWALVERRGRTAFFEATRPATVLFANEREAEALVGARGRAACRLAAGPHTRIVRLRPGAVDTRPRVGAFAACAVPAVDPRLRGKSLTKSEPRNTC
jgi:hypothetical protein